MADCTINFDKYNISRAFKNCFYIIPDYQREYVWGDKQINLLLNDIKSSYETNINSEYFIGTTIVSNSDITDNHYEVIDGQQRLTTLFLILCALHVLLGNKVIEQCIKDYATDDNGQDINYVRLTLNYDETSDLIRYISSDKYTPDKIQEYIDKSVNVTISMKKISNAYRLIFEFLQESFKDNTELSKFWGYLSSKVEFIQIRTDIGSALKIFETINERGIGLNPMDLLKNLIFYQVDKSQFSKINTKWKDIVTPLENHYEKPLRFLRYYIMANFTISNKYKDGVIREEQIFDWFKENKRLCCYEEKPIEFVDNIIKAVKNYINFIEGKNPSGAKNRHLYEFQKLCGGGFSLHNILLLAAANLPEALFNHLVEQLETVIFYYLMTKTSTKELEKEFSKWADEIRDISNIDNKNEQVKKYNYFIEKNFIPVIETKSEEYKNYFNICALGSLQKYRIKYILAKISQYVDNFIIGLNNDPKDIDNYLKLEIEHILPNTQKENVVKNFYQNCTLDDTIKNKEYDKYKIKLGNLTLLEKPINIIAGCDILSEKKSVYSNTDVYMTSSIIELKKLGSKNSSIDKINKKLKTYNIWNDKAIIDRQLLLYNLAKDVWNITKYEKTD